MDYISKIEGHPLKAESLAESVKTINETPYQYRPTPISANRTLEKLIGVSCAFNQLVQNGNFADTSGWSATRCTISASSNVLTVTGTGNDGFALINYVGVTNHKVLFSFTGKTSSIGSGVRLARLFYGNWNTQKEIMPSSTNYESHQIIVNITGTDVNLIRLQADGDGVVSQFKNVQIFDLTAMFGSEVADYLYNLENGRYEIF